jgi:hypothetical protein
MTKRTLVILPCLAIALALIGCSAGGDSGSYGQAQNDALNITPDPKLEGLEAGYFSSLVADFPGDPELYMMQQAPYSKGAEATSRPLFERSLPTTMQVPANFDRPASTVVPIGMSIPADFEWEFPRAKDVGGGVIEISSGSQTARILTFTDPNGVTRTATIGANGLPTLNGEDTVPRLLEIPGFGRAVITFEGNVVPVE